jgi:enoyl-CoA hydratase/carnithine racemase
VELTPALVRLPPALDAATVAALDRDVATALESAAPVVALAGASADTFCLGLAIDGAEPASVQAFADVLARLHAAGKPTLAVVDGRCIGGGMGLACACDWLVATERASFALPELLWGLVPAIIWPVISDRMPGHVARQWTIAAHSRPVAEAVAAGLVDDLAASAALESAVRRAVRMLTRLEPGALRHLRAWVRTSRHHDLPEALRLGAGLTAALAQQPIVKERWRAFAEGGAPWSV